MNLFKLIKQSFSSRAKKHLLIYLVIGLLILCTLSGKSRRQIQSAAVSANEKFIAVFETGEGHKIRCYCVDGSQAFEFLIPSELSAGGHCVVWYESDVLCALFYRTDKIARFSQDGEIMSISESKLEADLPKFPGFNRKATQLIYEGKDVNIICGDPFALGYWLFNLERNLVIEFENGETKTLLSWTAS